MYKRQLQDNQLIQAVGGHSHIGDLAGNGSAVADGNANISSCLLYTSSSYAVQAGREVRILVQPDKVSDDQVILLARNVAKKIENELDYPGQIKVSVIRESRATEYAK